MTQVFFYLLLQPEVRFCIRTSDKIRLQQRFNGDDHDYNGHNDDKNGNVASLLSQLYNIRVDDSWEI